MQKSEKKSLQLKTDERGWLIELLKGSELPAEIKSKGLGQVYLTVAKPGAIKGNHYHLRKTEWFCVIKGTAKLVLHDNKSKKTEEMLLTAENPCRIKIPPNTFHAIKNIGDEEMYVVCYIDEEFNQNNPDTYYDVKIDI